MVRLLIITATASAMVTIALRAPAAQQPVTREQSSRVQTPAAPPASPTSPSSSGAPSAQNGATAEAAPAAPSRATLGIALSDNTRGGVLILRVLPGTPAAAIGLQTGDRIMAIGGKPVANFRDVARLIATYKPNARVELRIDRGGWVKTLPVTLADSRALAVPVAPAAPPAVEAPPAVAPGSLLVRPEFEDETPADIDDQHGYGG